MGGNIMTEKRFNVFDVDGTVFLEDHIEGSYHIGEKENVDIPCLNDIADRLNTYAEENEQLKQTNQRLNDELQETMGYLALKSGVEKENEQLKRQIGNLEHTKDFCADVCADCERLEKENEQLKQSIWKCRLCGNTGTIEHIAKRNGDVE